MAKKEPEAATAEAKKEPEPKIPEDHCEIVLLHPRDMGDQVLPRGAGMVVSKVRALRWKSEGICKLKGEKDPKPPDVDNQARDDRGEGKIMTLGSKKEAEPQE